MRLLEICDRILKIGFYLLFFLVPLVFVSSTSELFEFNKMMLAYSLTIIIVAAWLSKMILVKKPIYRRTFLEIPLLIYLGSHILSTIFSIDPHISIWGYYSRFHEGLLASLSYILLYFAAVSNLNKDDVINIIKFSFTAGIIISIWGTLEHFGRSPSCLIVTGKFDANCWIQDVRSRVFATLGQPNWMAAYLNVLILTTIGFLLKPKLNFRVLGLSILFLLALWFTKSRSGLAGLLAGLGAFTILAIKIPNKIKVLICIFGLGVGILFGARWYQNLKPTPAGTITDSESIRKPVWDGAIKIWQRYPVFGSGVETFAYAFYLDRPVSKNLDSEWDFLYNKAHNEYLNILATTGTLGIIAYGLIIFTFAYRVLNSKFSILNASLFAAWVSILVTNFFGFSVVIIGLYFFLLPAFVEIISGKFTPETHKSSFGFGHTVILILICLIALMLEFNLFSRWEADKSYNLGKSYNSAQQFLQAYPYLAQAVQWAPDEPTFRSELAYNQAVLAGAIFEQLNTSTASALVNLSSAEKLAIKLPQIDISVADLSQDSIDNSNRVLETSPKSIPFWKDRVKIFFQLSLTDKKYFDQAVEAISTAARLAPTDAKIHYTLGWMLQRTGKIDEAKKVMQETISMKPDYYDAKKWLEDNK